MTARLADLTWPEVAELAPRSLLAVPVGATEQHGPHLPFTVDTDIAAELCDRLAQERPVLVAPPVTYGSSGEHAGFPGTLSIGQEAVEHLLVELVRSADAFAGVVLVSAHGGNAEPVRRTIETLRAEDRRVLAWAPTGRPDDTHAGRTETAAMLAIRPRAVRLERAERGNTTPLPNLIDTLRANGVRAATANGVLGDPTGATPEEGTRILTAWTKSLTATVDAWTPPDQEEHQAEGPGDRPSGGGVS
ncbi:mycofactocin biosynthesis peptidyl-dipeptidase MftE [Saccharopolyspora sp. ASAGF58]|uniref:mycofactocin biosynthesis peptidyl-dipeptidase MftE n=1 Tax=Saccharopolyspora sp. ASAGF58 TaxID=2719023 RepID=UPI00143FF1F8|nr:mycofactocin biosynthesis peptidyl-dipeptidase MftE [Saccharopolyspora sp. ASAGF58]QIZ37000.1 mycofactocin biosynthesis peptidyl-dipeptidase MftE [Saccharopolyspora sp. ASAGF58]